MDTYEGKGEYAELLRMSMEHLRQTDVKTDIPTDMSRDELRHWAYQLYIKDYLRCIAGIDENVGRILNYLDEQGLDGKHGCHLYRRPRLLYGGTWLV